MERLDQREYERLLAFRTGLVRHHSAVELIDRAVSAGLVTRRPDNQDARTVRIALTARGRDRLEKLAASHLEELARLTGQLHTLWAGLDTET